MSTKHLSLEPKDLRVVHGYGKAWRYEEGRGMIVVVEPAKGFAGETQQVRIPPKIMRDYLARLDKKP